MSNQLVIGFESANSSVKSVSTVHEEGFIYINSLLEVSEDNAKEVISQELFTGYYEIDGRYYTVSKNFTSPEVKSSWDVQPTRYKTPEFKIECLIAIYKHVEKIAVESSDDVVEVFAVTGLPINHVKDDAVVQSVKDALENTNEKPYHVVNGRKFKISEVKCTEQGLAAWLNDLMLPTGQYDAEKYTEFKKQNVIYCDNGFGTGDAILISEGKPFDRKALSGMQSAVTKVKNAIEERNASLGTSNFDIHLWNDVLRDGFEVVPPGTFTDEEKEIILKLKFEAYTSLAKSIVKELHNMKISMNLVHKVVFLGGGTIELESYIDRELTRLGITGAKRNAYVFINNEKDARLANARGYLKFAKRYFSKKVGVMA